jgi:hypothetical protein
MDGIGSMSSELDENVRRKSEEEGTEMKGAL